MFAEFLLYIFVVVVIALTMGTSNVCASPSESSSSWAEQVENDLGLTCPIYCAHRGNNWGTVLLCYTHIQKIHVVDVHRRSSSSTPHSSSPQYH